MNNLYSDGYTIKEILHMVKNHILVLFIVFISVLTAIVGSQLIRTTSFIATTTLLVEPLLNLESTSGSKTYGTDISNEIQYLNNHSTIVRALNNLDLTSFLYKDGSDYTDLLKNEKKFKHFRKNIGISQIKGTRIIDLSFRHSNPEFAQLFIQSLRDTFYIKLSEIADDQLDKEYQLLKAKVQEAEDNFAKIELSREEFQSNPIYIESSANRGIYQQILSFLDIRIRDVGFTYTGKTISTLLEEFKLQDSITTGLIEEYGKAYRKLLYYEISQLLNPTKSSEIESKDYYLTFYRDNVENLKIALLDHISFYTNTAEIKDIILQIISTVENSILIDERHYYLDKIEVYRSIDLMKEKINFDLTLEKNRVLQSINEIESFERYRSLSVDPIYTVDPIRLNDLKKETSISQIVFVGTLLGVFFGIIVLLLAYYFSDCIENEFFVKRVIGDKISFWGTLSKLDLCKINKKFCLGSFKDQSTSTSDTFNQIAAIIQYRKNTMEKPIYSFSSLGYGEASEEVVLNLALSLMRNCKRVLVIGANIVETNYQEIYSRIINSELLAATVSFENLKLNPINKSSSNLSLLHLTSIETEPEKISTFINSGDFESVIKTASKCYDFILIDSPTFKSPSDLIAVAKLANGLVLNLRQGISSKTELQYFLRTAYFSQVPILGLIFNAMYGNPKTKEKRRIKNLRANFKMPLHVNKDAKHPV